MFKMLNKKSQAVMEWLMTYGWAILVVVVAVGVLAYYGVFNPNNITSPPNCYCWKENMSFVKSARIDNIKYLECSQTKTKYIIKNNSIVKTINHTKRLFICDESEGVLIPYEFYLKALELEDD